MKYKDIYMLMVKPESTWHTPCEKGAYSLIPLSEENEGTALIMDLDEEHNVLALKRFEVYKIPLKFKAFDIKNETDVHKSYLVFRK